MNSFEGEQILENVFLIFIKAKEILRNIKPANRNIKLVNNGYHFCIKHPNPYTSQRTQQLYPDG